MIAFLFPLAARAFLGKYWHILAVLALLAGGLAFTHYKAYQFGKSSVTNSQNKADVKAVKEHAKLETKIIRLSDPDLDKRLSRWMRD